MTARTALSLILIACVAPLVTATPLDLNNQGSDDRIWKLDMEKALVDSWMVPAEAFPPLDDPVLRPMHYRFEFRNVGDWTLWYVVLSDNLESVDIAVWDVESERWSLDRSGDRVAPAQRSIPHRKTLFPLTLQSGQEVTIYVRIADFQSLGSAIWIMTPEDFHWWDDRQSFFTLFGISCIVAAALFSGFFFATGSSRMYLYYGLTLLLLVVTFLGKTRHLTAVFAPNRSYGYFIYLFGNSLACITGLLFIRRFLNFSKDSVYNRIQRVLVAVLFAVASVSVVTPLPIFAQPMNATILLSLLFILIATVRRSIKGDKAARIVTWSFVPLILGALVDNALLYFTDTFGTLGRVALIYGTVVHAYLIFWGLATRQSALNQRFHELRNRAKALSDSIQIDSLTGVLNRKGLEDRLNALGENFPDVENLCFAFVDIDNFKHYNDVYSHMKGDEILIGTARFLETHTRGTDPVFRYGGDEFLILMPGLDGAHARILCERLIADYGDFSASYRHSGDEVPLSLSIGLAVHSVTHGSHPRRTLEQADKALLEAKRLGKNRVQLNDIPVDVARDPR